MDKGKKKNIAFVIPTIAGGGLERRTVNIANALIEMNEYNIYVVTSKKGNNEYFLSNKIKRYELLYPEKGILNNVKQLIEFQRHNHINLFIGMGIYAGWLICLVKLRIRVKGILVEANAPKHDNLSKKSRLLRKLLYWNADGYIFQTEEEKKFYSESIQSRAVVIHNPVSDRLPYRKKPISPEIIAIGRLNMQKNYPLLLQAMKGVVDKHPEYKLRIFGEGELLDKMKSLSVNLKIENNVIFEGFCFHVHAKIVHSDIYVLSSDFEGMPNALMEAMAMGFPVISTDCSGGGPRELIENNANGLLVSVNDAKALENAICMLIEQPEFKEKLADKAKEIMLLHNNKTISMQWLYFIQNIMNERC